MGERIKILLSFSLLGFFAGIFAKLTYEYAVPWLISHFPMISWDWMLSGLAGALLTMFLVTIWAYTSETVAR
ncbi:MAG: hypothetical protein JSW53_04370 [Candidatus Bathyarchaeota archaeon]|nr:MAG: hypothetical protein JSW53_04370 [Candidatus Bathyarchaeota archaeon]